MATPSLEADRARIENLTEALFIVVRGELASDTPSQKSVYVALNALAIVAGTVLAGTGLQAAAASQFFTNAMVETFAQLREEDDDG